jgi:hypothetical protein
MLKPNHGDASRFEEGGAAVMQRRYWRAACAAGAVVTALIAAGCAASPGAGTPRPAAAGAPSAAAAAGGSHARTAKAKAAAAAAPRIPLTVPNSVRSRRAVTLTGCAATAAGGHASGTVIAPGTSRATYLITVFFTTRQATVIGYGTAMVRAVPGKATPWSVGRHFKAPPGMRCVLRGVSTR